MGKLPGFNEIKKTLKFILLKQF